MIQSDGPIAMQVEPWHEYAIPPIEGWMSTKEIRFLYDTAKEMDSIVELGSWCGRSTHALASGCKGTVYAVDHWNGSDGDPTQEIARQNDMFKIFSNNMRDFSNVKVRRGFAHDISTEFDSVDMVFIDAGHLYQECKRDIEDWLPKTRKLLCGHDYYSFAGVNRAVDEMFGKPDGVCETIWYKRIGV